MGPAQIQFAPDGHTLVVSEKGTNKLDTYVVAVNGTATGPDVRSSGGAVPYGFAFSADGHLLVTEAAGSAVSSYSLSSGTLTAVTSSLGTQQAAACWMVASGAFGYAVNARSNSVTGYRVAADGSLTLVDSSGISGTTGNTPLDAAISSDGRYLHVINKGDHSISSFRINSDGSLTKLPEFFDGPSNMVGLVSR